MVDLLSSKSDLVVRFQGGANAGHTVVIGDAVYKLHHIPSGIIHENVRNLIGPGVVINPTTIAEEIDSLHSRGHDLTRNFLISDRAHVVCPWHLIEDELSESPGGTSSSAGRENIGTTLRGIGPCYQDKVGRNHALRMGDLVADGLAENVARIAAYKSRVLSAIAERTIELDAEKIAADLRAVGLKLKRLICDTNPIVFDAIESGQSILLEGAQGSLLDIDHGTFPYVTSSNCSGVGVCAGSGVAPRWITEMLGIAKCYSTRVGGGPFPTELECETGQHIRDEGNEYGTTTGRPRRCGWFDAVAVRYTARLGGVDGLAMMMLDVLSKLEEIKICVAYELDGQEISHFPGSVADLRRVTPVYESWPGWKTDVTQVKSYEDLPDNALNYLRRISELVGCPIRYVSVGPERTQTIESPSRQQQTATA